MHESESRSMQFEKQYGAEAEPFLVTADKLHVEELDPDSHKGRNGRVCVIAGSDLFHGAGIFAAEAAVQVTVRYASNLNDGVYFCSIPKVVDALRPLTPSFIGIHRGEFDEYEKFSDVIVVGPGLMREPQEGRPETIAEPDFTRNITSKVLASGKPAVLDAGSLQVLTADQLKGKSNIIITPHRQEMARLFDIDLQRLETSHSDSFEQLSHVAQIVQKAAKEYGITILMKGPVDIIAGPERWLFSPGGNAGLTKGGTGDALAGLTGALYQRIHDPVLTAATASYVMKRTGERLFGDYGTLYDAQKVVESVGQTVDQLIKETVTLLRPNDSTPSQAQ